MGVQAVVVPGKGVRPPARPGVDGTHKNQMLVYDELQKGTGSEAHHRDAERGPGVQSRQFGILDLQGRTPDTRAHQRLRVAGHSRARCPGTEIFYSIQGNILRPGSVVPNAVQAFIKTQGTITDRVMAAMEAADGSGGDSRCLCPAWPSDGTCPLIPCDNKTAHVATSSRPIRKTQRRLAQQRQVLGVSHDVAARSRTKGPCQSRPGETESGQDACACAMTRGRRRSPRRTRLPNPLPGGSRKWWRRQLPESPRPIQTMTLSTHGVERWRNDSGEVHAGRRQVSRRRSRGATCRRDEEFV
jgi:hypothetical protein